MVESDNIATMTTIGTRECQYCKKVFDIPQNNPRKKFCSSVCQAADYHLKHKERRHEQWREWYQSNTDHHKIKTREYAQKNRDRVRMWKNEDLFGGLKRLILERDCYKCRACGGIDTVSVHHKDGTGYYSVGKDKSRINNVEDNLISLCQSCHQILHRWQERNDVVLIDDQEIIETLTEIKHARQPKRIPMQAAA